MYLSWKTIKVWQRLKRSTFVAFSYNTFHQRTLKWMSWVIPRLDGVPVGSRIEVSKSTTSHISTSTCAYSITPFRAHLSLTPAALRLHNRLSPSVLYCFLQLQILPAPTVPSTELIWNYTIRYNVALFIYYSSLVLHWWNKDRCSNARATEILFWHPFALNVWIASNRFSIVVLRITLTQKHDCGFVDNY